MRGGRGGCCFDGDVSMVRFLVRTRVRGDLPVEVGVEWEVDVAMLLGLLICQTSHHIHG